ncbi:MAG: S8 family serine peptidase, partial [Gemmataceae bacterium]|nr:S8 family serine peptidase [Gemmataceae bacterium]
GNVRRTIRLRTGSEEFAKELKVLLHTFGVRCHYTTEVDRKSGRPNYLVGIAGDRELCRRMRVKSVADVHPTKERVGASVVSIRQEDYDGPMYDLTVEGTTTYVANGHVVSNTHCSGTVAATDPRIGVATGYPLYHGKGLGDRGSGGSGLVDAVEWCVGEGCQVVSNSWGGGGQDAGWERRFREMAEAGVWLIFAGGNSGPNTRDSDWPGRSEHLLNVAALASDLTPASFSSAGDKLDTSGPGVDIWSCRTGGGFVQMSGTCIAEGEYVYTPQGPRKIETIQAGEVVYAQKDGKLVERVVYGVHDRGTAEVFRLTSGGRDVTATASHEFLTFNSKTREPEWVRLGQMTDRHRPLIPRRLRSQVNPYLDATLSRDFCWLAGFFTGDGWISYTTGGMRTNFASGDKAHVIAEVERIYHQVTGKHLRQNKSGTWHYDDSTRMAMIVDSLGMNHPANAKTVPMWVWSLSPDKQLAFYEGYRTADGHVIKAPERNGISDAFECVAGDLVRRLACLADYRGWKHGFVRSRTRHGKAPSSKEATWSTSHALNVYRTPLESGWTHATGRRDVADAERYARDAGIDPEHYATSSARVMEKSSRIARVYDLTVPDADCFVTQGLVTHNSMATPFVAGLLGVYRAALIARGLPVPNVYELRRLLQGRSTDAHTPGDDRRTGPGWAAPLLLSLTLTPDPPPLRSPDVAAKPNHSPPPNTPVPALGQTTPRPEKSGPDAAVDVIREARRSLKILAAQIVESLSADERGGDDVQVDQEQAFHDGVLPSLSVADPFASKAKAVVAELAKAEDMKVLASDKPFLDFVAELLKTLLPMLIGCFGGLAARN